MVERSPYLTAFSHLIMVLGVIIVGFPLYLAFVASTHTAQDIVQVPMPMVPGGNFWQTYHDTLFGGGSGAGSTAPVARMMWVSFVTAIVITVGKIAISLLSAFAVVYFRFPGRTLVFWLIFVTLMLPVEVRIGPTYQVVADLGGSFSAEHGVGLMKLNSMRRRKDPVALDVMRLLKATLDPQGIMNPGKLGQAG